MDTSTTPPPAGATPPPHHGTMPASSGPGAAPRPPLRRPREGRVLGGVAAGLADHLGLDVALVRLLIVLATIITQGFGLLAYLVAVVVIPSAEPGAPRPAATRRDPALGGRSPAFWGGIALVVFGLWWLLAVTPVRLGFLPGVNIGGLAAPLLLIGVGLALWVTGDRAGSAPTTSTTASPAAPPKTWAAAPATTPPTSPAYMTPQEPAMTPSGTTTPGADTTSVPASSTPPSTTPPSTTPPTPPAPPTGGGGGQGEGWTPPPAPERSGGLLGRATVGLVLVTVGLLWSLRLAGVLAITGGQLLAAALLIVGLGLLVGSIAGRARGLIWLGAVLLPLVLIAQVPTPGWIETFPSITTESGAAGEVRLVPTDLEDLRGSYELGAGSIRLDLTELPFDGEDVEVELSVGVGEIEVLVPDDLDLDATASIGIGEIQLLDRSSGGIGVGDVEVRSEASGVARGSVTLELSAGIGEIDVQRVEATESSS